MARTYDDSIRAAVMTALLEGQSVSAAAKQYGVPKGTVSGWKRRITNHVQAEGRVVADPKRDRIGDLLIRYMEQSLESLIAQQKVFAEPEWIRKQSASELAVLHGVTVDKVFRIAEVIAGDGEGQDAG